MTEWNEAQLNEWIRLNLEDSGAKLLSVAMRIHKGENVPYPERVVEIPFTPLRADFAALHQLFRNLWGLISFDPTSLLILVRNQEKQIIQASLLKAEDNVYTSAVEIAPEADWTETLAQMRAAGRWDDFQIFLNQRLAAKYKIQANWITLVDIRLLQALAEAQAGYRRDRDVLSYLLAVYQALEAAFAEDRLLCTPAPPVYRWLKGWLAALIHVTPEHLDVLRQWFKLAPEAWVNPPLALVLRREDFCVGFKLGGKDHLEITINQDILTELESLPLTALARETGRRIKAPFTLALNFAPLQNVIYEMMERPLPRWGSDAQFIISKLLTIVKNYGQDWALAPVPLPLKNYVRVPVKLLGLPYDLNNLAAAYLAKLAVQGLPLVLGSQAVLAVILLDRDRVNLVVLFELREGGISWIKTVSPEIVQPAFSGAKLEYEEVRSHLEHAKFLIWEQETWTTQAIAIQKQLIEELLALINPRWLSSLIPFLGYPWRLKKIQKLAAQGGVAVYPDKIISRAAEWAEHEGLWSVLSALIQAPFDRKHPKTRGLLYVKETALLTGGSVLAIILILLAVL